MTNEQTYLFLKQYRSQIYAAILESEALTPDENRATRKIHKSNFCFRFCTIEKNPSHFIDKQYTPSLEPLYDLLDSIDEDLNLLQTGIGDSLLEKSACNNPAQ